MRNTLVLTLLLASLLALASASSHAQEELDFGDAPDGPYPTLLINNGAWHQIVTGVFMGGPPDPEPDGQPDPAALGDDLVGGDDEDGVNLAGPWTPGSVATVDVSVSIDGYLDVWFDWNQNGSWLDAGDHVFSGPVTAGMNNIFFGVPAGTPPGATFARFRYNSAGPLPVDGGAGDGEVEDYEVIIGGSELDYGDAPDPSYRTLLASNGARHQVVPGVYLGTLVDTEGDGQPDPNAEGDDNTNLSDEDGVVFVTPLVPGAGAQVDVTASTSGWLDAWIDFDQSGTWSAGEQIYSGGVSAGVNSISFTVPAGSIPGQTFSRFRFNVSGVALQPFGAASDGEVEDHEVTVEEPMDFGDAPDQPYPTLLASNGARHPVDPTVYMGLRVDDEADGQPDPSATGDDLAGSDDEDGVTFVTPVVPGGAAQVDVGVSANGWLDAWFDWNQNGSWLDPGELVFSGNVAAGVNSVNFVVPAVAVPGAQVFARFRYNVGGAALAPDGAGPTGEVEDYAVIIEDAQLDFGDAPDQPYPTLLASNGARHIIVPNVYMGVRVDDEPDGQPDGSATGDDLANTDDEDGVVFPAPLVVGQVGQADVTVSVDGHLDVWFDWNQNGSWLDPGEHVFSGAVVAGVNATPVSVPAAAIPGGIFSRFRFNLSGALSVDGSATDGEVEDYLVEVQPSDDRELDYGDAPDQPYPTLLASNGARHLIDPALYLGNAIDSESDGQPDGSATGDDNAGAADEDGVTFSPIEPVTSATVLVVASAPGLLDAWIDFDQSGTWDAVEQIFSSEPLGAGINVLNYNVPGTGQGAFNTFARFRFSTAGGLTPEGYADDGEVEDYRVLIEEDLVTDAGGATLPYALHDAVPNPFNPQTTLSFSLPSVEHVRLAIYDVHGRAVRTLVDGRREAGLHHEVWDGRDDGGHAVSSGVYFCRMQAGTFTRTRRVVLLK